MAEIFLSASIQASIQASLEKLLSLDLEKCVSREGIHTAVEKWWTTLREIQAVITDAEEKHITDRAGKIWLKKLRDFACNLEDILDEYKTKALRCNLTEKPRPSTSKVRNIGHIFSTFNPSAEFLRLRMTSKLKGMCRQLQHIVTQRRDWEFTQDAGRNSNRTSESRETGSIINESEVYGREKDKEVVLELLRGEASDNKVSVIPLLGMPGVGKTVVARLAYNDEKVKGDFDLRAWVYISEDFDVTSVTKMILKSFTLQTSDVSIQKKGKAIDIDDLDQLQVLLKEVVNNKKCLIVFDDVWLQNYNEWTKLRSPLEAAAPGSKVILTTRNRGVSETLGTLPPHILRELSNDDCMSIFTQHALGARGFDAHPDLRRIAKELVERCKGLPLVAKDLGGLLHGKVNPEEWEDVLNKKIWDLPEKSSCILPTLASSYYQLPPHLKQCFTFFSMLPKDYEFEEEEVVQLWMAESLVQQQNETKRIEDVGGEYFRDLLSMSFFQPSRTNHSRFVMHDLIHDLAQWAAQETCFRLKDKLKGEKQCKISENARHFFYVGSRYDGVSRFKALDKVNCLQTFLPLKTAKGSYLTHNVLRYLLPKCRRLRVLSLRGYRIRKLPNSMGKVNRLRYLDLSDTEIRSLPKSVSTFYNLQTLKLRNCSRLKKLPRGMRNLSNLRHLDIKGAYSIAEMPPGVGGLTNLQTLSDFIVGNKSGDGIGELMNLNSLRGSLCISKLENVTNARDARRANLKDKQYLDALTLEWSSSFNDNSRKEEVEEGVLDMLETHERLKELTIKWYGGTRISTWITDASLSNMVVLRLEDCVKCTSLPPLGQLPFLKDLCIERMTGVHSVGPDFYGRDCPTFFPSLETLRFGYMEEWEDWCPCGVDGQVAVFPCLRQLFIERCPKLLQKIPNHLPSLEKLIIHGCPQLVVSISSLPKIVEIDIEECKEVVQGDIVDLSSLKSVFLSKISNLMCLTKGFVQFLTKVEHLKIVGCNELTSLWQKEMGLLRYLTSLHHLKIKGCPNIVSLVAEEVEQHLETPCRLESLELSGCDNLENLQGLHRFTFLRELIIQGCPKLVFCPEIGLPSSLIDLRIEHCNALESLLWLTLHCSDHASLENLCIDGCDSLMSFTRGQLPPTLRKLYVLNCKNLQSLLGGEECTTSFSSSPLSSLSMQNSNNSNASLLEYLFVSECPSLTSLSSRAVLPATLKLLCINGCPQLETVVESLRNNTSLECFGIYDCECLESLPNDLPNFSQLYQFEIERCPNLVSFPDGGLPATKLRLLRIYDCERLNAPSMGLCNLRSLRELTIARCPGIVSLEVGFPSKLISLEIIHLNSCMPLLNRWSYRFTSLRRLIIEGGCPDLVSFPEEEMMLPETLTSLSIRDFPKLKCLSSKGFQNLTSLEELCISFCPKLKSFPKEGLLSRLLRLDINECPLLKYRCKKDRGPDWLKVAHIPSIHIDGRFIFEPED